MEVSKMNYYFTGILIILMTLLAFCGGPAHAGSTQTNTSGSNTAIEGGYTSTATTTYQSGSSSNSTTNSTTNSNTKSSPPSFIYVVPEVYATEPTASPKLKLRLCH